MSFIFAPKARAELRARAAAGKGSGFLSRADYIQRHAPDAADEQRLLSFLSDPAVRVTLTRDDHSEVRIQATVGRLQSMLQTTINLYQLNGKQFYANATNPKLPPELTGKIQAVRGLNSAAPFKPHIQSAGPASLAAPGAVPYGPADIRAAYNFNPLLQAGLTGSGQTIGIITLAPFAQSDITSFENSFGLPHASVNVVSSGGIKTPGCPTGGNDETTLDVEWSSSMAPNAAIKVFEGVDNCDLGDAVNAAIQDADAKVLSLSWGSCEANFSAAELNALDNLFARAAVMGKSVFVASGDSGSDDCGNGDDPPTVDFPASSPHVTAVGGTTLLLNRPSATIASEVGWSLNGGLGSGGGCSQYWPKPSWQRISPCNSRGMPDISADADPGTGYSVYYSGGLWQFGGTSVAAPVWAGLMTLMNQGRANQSMSSEGLFNTDLYGSAIPGFHDITRGENGAYSAGPGWDAITGMGSPDAWRLATALGAASAVALNLNTTSVSAGGTVTVSWSGIPSPTALDFIGLYQPNDPDNPFRDYMFVSCAKSPSMAVASGSCAFPLPTTPGSYQLRLFSNGTYSRLGATSSVTVTSAATATPTITPTARAAVTLSASLSSFSAGSSVTLSWANVSSATPNDWLGLYHPGDSDGAYLDYIWDSSCSKSAAMAQVSGSCTFAVPNAGTYQFRLFANESLTRLAVSGQVTVNAAPTATPTITPTAGPAVTLSASPSTITAGSSVTLSWANVSSATPNDWLGLYHPGDSDGVYVDYIWDSSCSKSATTAQASGSCTFMVPTAGTYQFRLFANESLTRLAVSGQVTATSAPTATPTITPTAGPAVTLSASPSSLTAGNSVTLTWANVSNAMPNDWLGLYHPGDSDGVYLDYIWDSSCSKSATTAQASGSCTFAVPNAGTYQFRLFANESLTRLAVSGQVTVNPGPAVTLNVGPSSLTAGSSVILSWTNVSNPTPNDWLGLYHPGDGDGAYLDYIWDSSCSKSAAMAQASGSCTFAVPNAGTYQFRLFSNESLTRLAVSGPIIVNPST